MSARASASVKRPLRRRARSSSQRFSMRLAAAGSSCAGRMSSRSATLTLGPSRMSKRSLSMLLKSR
ncbi:hypothetical protein PPSIR1_11380 [Plesiocystis pacifica SIR-1]|uniref:Uncharacterized protein n=1 Tax=Plesiocystis pacifica SIR-1 TaxID=391625 RepID=A6G179_9BACT|nr:hypothetical protein PPSIR1_11380 [Plesiocystis pacifica SIR-1]